MYDIQKIRADFPILNRQIDGKPNIYLDSAASAQKPKCVIEAMENVYLDGYANVHRGLYRLSEEITEKYEHARQIVRKFLNARSADEIVYTRNATESINLVAASWAMNTLKENDEILISQAEHHANLIPWQIVCEKTGAKLKIFAIGDDGSFLENTFAEALSPKTKLVAVTGMSNVLGTVFPIKKITKTAHDAGAKVLIDACQVAVHNRIDVQDVDCDFLAFSGHKTYGPTGIGVLYGKAEILESMPPYQTGGDMVDKVTYEKTTFAPPPARFEAGTPAIVQAIGLGRALDYMMELGMDNICRYEDALSRYFQEQSKKISQWIDVGNAPTKSSVFSFQIGNIHPQDLAFILDKEGVAIRVGHHCAEPLVSRMGYTSVARASLGLYSNQQDIDAFFQAVEKACRFF